MQTPRISDPIEGGRRGYPFGSYVGDLDLHGYVEEEFFVEGISSRYRPTGELTEDGKWTVEPADAVPYKTRILVRRPRDADRFNGTVVVEWVNVTLGWELGLLGTVSQDIYRDGFALVIASCQQVGLEGFSQTPQGLKVWDPERYGSLSIPGDSFGFDIFSQVGRSVGPNRPQQEVDPLGDLEVRNVIATGSSQSAARLRTYLNAIHVRDHVYDAFMPTIDFGRRVGFDDQVLDPTLPPSKPRGSVMANPSRIRDDLNTPVLVVNSETESLFYLTSRQSDSESFRYWEIAGASHGPAPNGRYMKNLQDRDALPNDGPVIASEVTWQPTADAALFALVKWIEAGHAPSRQPRIEINSEAKPEVVRDELGNACGGVRLPEVEVPVARYECATTQLTPGSLNGKTSPLESGVLKQLYATPGQYQSQVESAANSAMQDGVIRPGRFAEYIDAAKSYQS